MRFVVAVVAVLFSGYSALAAEGGDHYTLEVSGGTTAGLVLTTGSVSTSTYSIETEIAYPVSEPMLDVALDLSFDSSNRDDASGHASVARTTLLTAVGGLQVNLGDKNPRDAFFLFGGAGLTYVKAEIASDTKFTYRFRGGKRFAITSSICYAPFVRFTKTKDVDGELAFIPFAFSLFL